MNYTIFFTICSLFYSIMLMYVIFKQKIPQTTSNTVFKGLSIINFVCIIVDIIYNYVAVTQKTLTIPIIILSRIFLISLICWIITFTLYIYATLFNEKGKSNKELNASKKNAILVSLLALIIASIVVIILPVHHNFEEIYSYGPAINFVNYFSDACLAVGLICMFKNYNTTKRSKCAPFFAFIAGGVMMAVLQSYDPKLLLIVAVETFVTFMIYFTLDKEDKAEQ